MGHPVSGKLLFTPWHHPFLQNGSAIVALVHIRGGSEKGIAWHTEGQGLRKQQGVIDLEYAMKFAIEHALCSPNWIGFYCTSASGLVGG